MWSTQSLKRHDVVSFKCVQTELQVHRVMQNENFRRQQNLRLHKGFLHVDWGAQTESIDSMP